MYVIRYSEVTEEEKENWNFKCVMGKEGKCGFEIFNKTYYPEDLNGIMLKYLLSAASKKLNRKIKNIVGTVPAYWNSTKKRETKNSSYYPCTEFHCPLMFLFLNN